MGKKEPPKKSCRKVTSPGHRRRGGEVGRAIQRGKTGGRQVSNVHTDVLEGKAVGGWISTKAAHTQENVAAKKEDKLGLNISEHKFQRSKGIGQGRQSITGKRGGTS